MTKEYVLQNISIAQRYLAQFHLLVPPEEVVFDCCFLPPFHWKAFYAQVKRHNGKYLAHCTCTYYADSTGTESVSQSFVRVQEADQHPSKRGDMICKCIRLATETVDALLHSAMEDVFPKVQETAVIDGFTATIRCFEQGKLMRDIFLNDRVEGSVLPDILFSISEQL